MSVQMPAKPDLTKMGMVELVERYKNVCVIRENLRQSENSFGVVADNLANAMNLHGEHVPDDLRAMYNKAVEMMNEARRQWDGMEGSYIRHKNAVEDAMREGRY